MPNWCENDLTIRGHAIDIEAVLQFVRSGDEAEDKSLFSFERIVAMPPELHGIQTGAIRINGELVTEWRTIGDENVPVDTEELQRRYGATSWYEWNTANWGTKWPATDVEVEYRSGDERAVIHFSTAWSPPVPVVTKLAEKFPQLDFDLRYYEGGAAFKGRLQLKGGRVVHDSTGPYHGSRGG